MKIKSRVKVVRYIADDAKKLVGRRGVFLKKTRIRDDVDGSYIVLLDGNTKPFHFYRDEIQVIKGRI